MTIAPVQKVNIPGPVRLWLLIGVMMVFMQVIIGGITRLTGSGLSITKWEIVTGSIPPIGEASWNTEFDAYKETPQYKKINLGMTMSEFKFIYFWEWFHRFWARTIGLVFFIPFLIFLKKGWLPNWLLKRLGITILLAMLAASFGWIMVQSGLINRPWVSAYKLTFHLMIGLTLFGYLWWTAIKSFNENLEVIHSPKLKMWINIIIIGIIIQIALGGVMSGMKAALFYPTWPDMYGEYIPSILFESYQWTVGNFVEYEQSTIAPALVQFLHRGLAYLLTIIILYIGYGVLRSNNGWMFRGTGGMLIILLIIQVGLGIFTLLYSIGKVPVGLGVFHQGVGFLLFAACLLLRYQVAGYQKLSNVENIVENPS